MTDRWQQAWDETQARITAHPDFPRLVREVAVAEQNTGIPRRYSLNSLTYGLWFTRGNRPMPTQGGKSRRARLFAQKIAKDCQVHPTLPPGEGEARVYGAARDYVRARERGISGN